MANTPSGSRGPNPRQAPGVEHLRSAPHRMLHSGSFYDARRTALDKDKWLLVDLQSPQVNINREFWADKGVQVVVRKLCIFWQKNMLSQVGDQVGVFYDVRKRLCVLLIHPLTGEKIRQWGHDTRRKTWLEDMAYFSQVKPSDYRPPRRLPPSPESERNLMKLKSDHAERCFQSAKSAWSFFSQDFEVQSTKSAWSFFSRDFEVQSTKSAWSLLFWGATLVTESPPFWSLHSIFFFLVNSGFLFGGIRLSFISKILYCEHVTCDWMRRACQSCCLVIDHPIWKPRSCDKQCRAGGVNPRHYR